MASENPPWTRDVWQSKRPNRKGNIRCISIYLTRWIKHKPVYHHVDEVFPNGRRDPAGRQSKLSHETLIGHYQKQLSIPPLPRRLSKYWRSKKPYGPSGEQRYIELYDSREKLVHNTLVLKADGTRDYLGRNTAISTQYLLKHYQPWVPPAPEKPLRWKVEAQLSKATFTDSQRKQITNAILVAINA